MSGQIIRARRAEERARVDHRYAGRAGPGEAFRVPHELARALVTNERWFMAGAEMLAVGAVVLATPFVIYTTRKRARHCPLRRCSRGCATRLAFGIMTTPC